MTREEKKEVGFIPRKQARKITFPCKTPCFECEGEVVITGFDVDCVCECGKQYRWELLTRTQNVLRNHTGFVGWGIAAAARNLRQLKKSPGAELSGLAVFLVIQEWEGD